VPPTTCDHVVDRTLVVRPGPVEAPRQRHGQPPEQASPGEQRAGDDSAREPVEPPHRFRHRGRVVAEDELGDLVDRQVDHLGLEVHRAAVLPGSGSPLRAGDDPCVAAARPAAAEDAVDEPPSGPVRRPAERRQAVAPQSVDGRGVKLQRPVRLLVILEDSGDQVRVVDDKEPARPDVDPDDVPSTGCAVDRLERPANEGREAAQRNSYDLDPGRRRHLAHGRKVLRPPRGTKAPP
jgi:hypothetical protein